MKTLIACYSYSGHTLKVAKKIQKEIDADLTVIEAEKDRWYLFKILDSIREKKAKIKPCQTDLMNYDKLILCCPVWASKTPAAINQYMFELKNIKGKEFGVFVTSGGSRSQMATIQMREYLDLQGMKFSGQMRLITKDVETEKYGEIFPLFTAKFKGPKSESTQDTEKT
jgi:flavodoxin